MTSSSEARVLRGSDVAHAVPLATPDLRSGTWTRMGDEAVLGDDHTELVLGGLADRARNAAEAQGYADGWAKGVRDAIEASAADRAREAALAAEREAVRAVEHAAAVAALRAAAVSLDARAATVCVLIEERAIEIALAVTEAVLGRQAARTAPEDVVRRVLDVLPDGEVVRVRLHPAVAESAAPLALPASVTVVADPTMGPADGVAELDDHLLDLRVEGALDRVRRALR